MFSNKVQFKGGSSSRGLSLRSGGRGPLLTAPAPAAEAVSQVWSMAAAAFIVGVFIVDRRHIRRPLHNVRERFYRVSLLVVDLIWLTWNLIVPLSAQLCLGWWEFSRSGLVGGQNGGIKVNQTQIYAQMGYPVLANQFTELPKNIGHPILNSFWFPAFIKNSNICGDLLCFWAALNTSKSSFKTPLI